MNERNFERARPSVNVSMDAPELEQGIMARNPWDFAVIPSETVSA